MIANKTDLTKRRIVSENEGRAFAAENELEYFESSAVSCNKNKSFFLFIYQKEKEGINEPFEYLAKEFMALYKAKIDQIQSLVLS